MNNAEHCSSTQYVTSFSILPHLVAYATSIVRAESGVILHSHSSISSSLCPNPDLTSNEDGVVFPSIPISLHILPCCSLANGLVMTSASMSFMGQYWSLIVPFSMLLRTNWSWMSRCLVLAW